MNPFDFNQRIKGLMLHKQNCSLISAQAQFITNDFQPMKDTPEDARAVYINAYNTYTIHNKMY